MLFQRILTVVIAAPFLIGALVYPRTEVFKTVVALCILVGLVEFYQIVHFPKRERFFAVGVGFLHTLYLLFCPERGGSMPLEITLLVLAIFAFYSLSHLRSSTEGGVTEVAQQISFTLLGSLYVGTFGAFVGLLRDSWHGIFWVFLLLGMTWLNDTAAYFFGHRFGRHRMAPQISPGKTVEGFLGGFVGSFAGFLIFWFLFRQPIPFVDGLLLTILVGLFGPLGDLSESLIKRSFGVKDSGNIIPGHGGMLDRIDALLFTAPVIYFFATR